MPKNKPKTKRQPKPATLGDQFRTRRSRLKWSQAEAADRAGLMRKTVNQIETSAGDPCLSSLATYAAALGCRLAVHKVP